jgi:hypothetical protein
LSIGMQTKPKTNPNKGYSSYDKRGGGQRRAGAKASPATFRANDNGVSVSRACLWHPSEPFAVVCFSGLGFMPEICH